MSMSSARDRLDRVLGSLGSALDEYMVAVRDEAIAITEALARDQVGQVRRDLDELRAEVEALDGDPPPAGGGGDPEPTTGQGPLKPRLAIIGPDRWVEGASPEIRVNVPEPEDGWDVLVQVWHIDREEMIDAATEVIAAAATPAPLTKLAAVPDGSAVVLTHLRRGGGLPFITAEHPAIVEAPADVQEGPEPTAPATPVDTSRPERFRGARTLSPGRLDKPVLLDGSSSLWLAPGGYSSDSLVIGPGVALGAEPGTVTIHLAPGASIKMRADAMLYGLRVQGGNHGVIAEGAPGGDGKTASTHNVRINRCAFVDQFNHAVYAAYASKLRVTDCVFEAWGFRDGETNPWDGGPASGTRYAVYALACERGAISRNVFGWPTQPTMTPVQHRTADPDESGYQGQVSTTAACDNVVLQDLVDWDSAIRFQANGGSGKTFREVIADGNTCLGDLGEGATIVSIGNTVTAIKRSHHTPTPEPERRDLLAACLKAGHSGPAMQWRGAPNA